MRSAAATLSLAGLLIQAVTLVLALETQPSSLQALPADQKPKETDRNALTDFIGTVAQQLPGMMANGGGSPLGGLGGNQGESPGSKLASIIGGLSGSHGTNHGGIGYGGSSYDRDYPREPSGYPTRDHSGYPNRENSGYPGSGGYPRDHSGYPSRDHSGYPSRDHSGYPSRDHSGYPSRDHSHSGYPRQPGHRDQGYGNQGYGNQGYGNQGYGGSSFPRERPYENLGPSRNPTGSHYGNDQYEDDQDSVLGRKPKQADLDNQTAPMKEQPMLPSSPSPSSSSSSSSPSPDTVIVPSKP